MKEHAAYQFSPDLHASAGDVNGEGNASTLMAVDDMASHGTAGDFRPPSRQHPWHADTLVLITISTFNTSTDHFNILQILPRRAPPRKTRPMRTGALRSNHAKITRRPTR